MHGHILSEVAKYQFVGGFRSGMALTKSKFQPAKLKVNKNTPEVIKSFNIFRVYNNEKHAELQYADNEFVVVKEKTTLHVG